jgi:plasmid stability protein
MLKNITFSAEEDLIRRARKRAAAEGTTLNDEFRRWLEKYVERPETAEAFADLMGLFEYARPGRSFRREEMNER